MNALKVIKLTFATSGGLCLFAAACSFIYEIDFKLHSVDLVGVVDDNRGHAIGLVYSYEFPSGVHHRKSPRSSSTEWQWLAGDTIPLQVDSRDPDRTQIKEFVDQWIMGTLLGIFGIIFGGVGFGMIFFGIQRDRIRKYLLDRGTKIQAKIKSVIVDEATFYDNQNPFLIHAEAQIDGTKWLFESDHILFDPTAYVENRTVDIYYLPENPEKYYMDLSFLPKFAN